MKLTLYHYLHCPFCIRVRLVLGFLNLPYESKVLQYDDEDTPLSLTGVKMLPIMEIDGEILNESLQIIKKLDKNNLLKTQDFLNSAPHSSHCSTKEVTQTQVDPEKRLHLTNLLDKLGKSIHSLAMPYWIFTPEFSENSRLYFQHKKEKKRGPFKDLLRNRAEFEKQLQSDLVEVEKDLTPYYQSSDLTLLDLLLASHLWGMYVVPEFQFSEKIHQYLQDIKNRCQFHYLENDR